MPREYMDEQDRAYVQATKRHFRRWVSPLNDQFMPLGAAHHICRRLGIDIQAILLPQGSTTTARATRIFYSSPQNTPT